MTIVDHPASFGYSPATEYVFPLSRADLPVSAAGIAHRLGTDSATVTTSLDSRFAAIHSPEVRAFTSVFDGMAPYAFLMQDQRAWVVMKKRSSFDEATEYGNSILLPAVVADHAAWESAFEVSPRVVEFLNQFGGLTLIVPPGGFCASIPDQIMPICRDSFHGLGDWEPAIGMFYPGNGDIIIARQDGAAGLWQHELAPDGSSCDESSPQGAAILGIVDEMLKSLLPDTPRPPRPECCVADLGCDFVTAIQHEVGSALRHVSAR
ncbi:MAG: hypothetical protein HS117_24895 [Verrucomicrobiaceae bacterium]|jgi:hypothetical protein|nr:hypothetical protein [Verrucomicrobiaceae bacterium]